MRLTFTIRTLLVATALGAVAASVSQTDQRLVAWLLAIGYCCAAFASMVAVNVRELPDERVFRVAVFCSVTCAVATLLLHACYLGTTSPWNPGGRSTIDIFVNGNGLSLEDARAIRDAVGKTPNPEPILMIRRIEPHTVEVYTGEVRGPLSGGGEVLLLRRIEGVWTLVNDGIHRSWMS